MQTRWILGCAWCVVSIASADTRVPAAAVPGSSSVVPPTTTPAAWQAPGPTATSAGEPIEIDSYRLPLALADTASSLVMILGAASNREHVVIVGMAGFVLAGPLLHTAHDQGGRGGVSLVLRVALPLSGLLLGARLGRNSHYHCDYDDICDRSGEQAGLGLFLGMLGAALIDNVAVARPVEIRRPARAGWAPGLSAGRHQASLGIVGRF